VKVISNISQLGEEELLIVRTLSVQPKLPTFQSVEQCYKITAEGFLKILNLLNFLIANRVAQISGYSERKASERDLEIPSQKCSMSCVHLVR